MSSYTFKTDDPRVPIPELPQINVPASPDPTYDLTHGQTQKSSNGTGLSSHEDVIREIIQHKQSTLRLSLELVGHPNQEISSWAMEYSSRELQDCQALQIALSINAKH